MRPETVNKISKIFNKPTATKKWSFATLVVAICAGLSIPDLSAFGVAVPGIVSGNLPEKYEQKVILELPRQKVIQLFLKDGETEPIANYYYNAVAGDPDFNAGEELGRFGVDQKENIYLMFPHSVYVFDNRGTLVHSLPQTSNSNEDAVVDEDGNVAILDHFNWHFFDSDGNPVSKVVKRGGFPGGFSHGTFYSPQTGEITFKMKSGKNLENKYFVKDMVKIKRERIDEHHSYLHNFYLTNGKKLPREIDGFVIQYVDHLDDAGNIYAGYVKQLPNKYDVPIYQWRIFKFSSDGQLLAKFDYVHNSYIFNSQTQDVYHFDVDKNALRIIKFEKIKN